MGPFFRVLVLALVCAGVGAGVAGAFFGSTPEAGFGAFLFACIGVFIGAVAGAAREVVAALHARPLD